MVQDLKITFLPVPPTSANITEKANVADTTSDLEDASIICVSNQEPHIKMRVEISLKNYFIQLISSALSSNSSIRSFKILMIIILLSSKF